MNLSPAEIDLFFSAWVPLLAFADKRLSLGLKLPKRRGEGRLDISDAVVARDQLWDHPEVHEEFLRANPAGLVAAQLELVASWRHRVRGKFFIVKCLRRHAVFLAQGDEDAAFAVLGLASPIDELLPIPPPVSVEGVLLPFGTRIVHDGLLVPDMVAFGSNYRRSIEEAWRAIERRGGLITSLPRGNVIEEPTETIQSANDELLKQHVADLAGSRISWRTVCEDTGHLHELGAALLADAGCRLVRMTPALIERFVAHRPGSREALRRLASFLARTDAIDSATARELTTAIGKSKSKRE